METTDKYYHVEPVGPVLIKKNNRSHRIRLRVNPDGKVLVSMPSSGSDQKALDFVRAKSDWILKQQQNIKAGLTVFTPETSFKTRFHLLKIIRVEHAKVSAMVGKGIVQINIPRKQDCQHPGIQQFIRRVIVQVMRQEARIYLPQRLNELAKICNLQFENVYVKHVKSRWGSCSSANNINLNLHLMRLPDRLIDYVLLHELAHTVEKNHGPGFWNLMEKICPGAGKLDKELKHYRVDIF
jgi:predicted metal-dependent hydrolase